MINKLCLILAGVPMVILYIVKCFENKHWLTFPLAILIILTLIILALIAGVSFFVHIGWLPED